MPVPISVTAVFCHDAVMEKLIANITSGKVRKTFLHGRPHIVVPVSMIVPGVLNGSGGPILYTREENVKSVNLWNGMPVTVNHPVDDDGTPTSARSPGILDKWAIGTVMNTSSNGKLVAEVFLDVNRTNQLDRRIIRDIERGKPIELSTGLFMDKEKAPEDSVHNGEPYDFIARNFRPDHLAILPDEVGACSIKDGCGVLVNRHGMSQDEIRNTLDQLLAALFTQDEARPFITEIFEDFMVFEQGEKLFRKGFKIDDNGGIELLGDDPEEVNRKIDFVPVDNQSEPIEENHMADKKLVDALISNCCCWTEDDREVLGNMSDKKVQQLIDKAKEDKQTQEKVDNHQAVVDAVKKGFQVGNDHYTINEEGKMVKKEEAPVANKDDTSPQKADEKNIENRLTPEEIEDLKFARNERQRQKDELVAKLTANQADEDKESVTAVLNTKSLDELRVLTKLVPEQPQSQQRVTPNFAGAAAPANNQQANTGGVNKKDFLPLPTINWSEERNKKSG